MSVAAHLVQLDARPGATEDLLKSVLHALLKLLQGQCVRVCVCVQIWLLFWLALDTGNSAAHVHHGKLCENCAAGAHA